MLHPWSIRYELRNRHEAKQPLQSTMPVESAQYDVVRWRSWPCEECCRRAPVLDFFSRRHEASGALSSDAPDEIIDESRKRERLWLPEWAASCPHGGEVTKELAKLSEGSEHLVYFSEDGETVLKLTLPGIFGDSYFVADGRVNQRCCTPGDYLVRMGLLALVFDFAPKIVGVTASGQIVTLQKFVEGDCPTQEEADEFLRELRFEPVRQNCFLWKRAEAEDGFEYWIGDARDENFVKTASDIVPIDLRMWAVEIGEAE